MIIITGDTHGTIDYGKIKEIAKKYPSLTEKDYLIIAGDFGAVWNEKTLQEDLRPYTDFRWTTLFVDGNHENFDLLNTYPIEEWNGGKVHRIAPNIIHLMRGQVFTIEGKTFFTFGGATSIDKAWRKEGVSWWPQEVPSDADICEANTNLGKVGFKVDYIVTHSCDEKALYYPPLSTNGFRMSVFPENRILSYFEDVVDYRHWYFGHYHLDADLNDKKTVLYNTYRVIE